MCCGRSFRERSRGSTCVCAVLASAMTGTRTRARTQALAPLCLQFSLLRSLSSAAFDSAVILFVLLADPPTSFLLIMFFCLSSFLQFLPILVRPLASIFFVVFLVVLHRLHLQMSRKLVHKLFSSEHKREHRERCGLQKLLRIAHTEVPDLRPPVGSEPTSM